VKAPLEGWIPEAGDAASGRAAPHRELLGTNSIRQDSRLQVAPVSPYARFMIIHDYS
jgi:hypothetical protein